MNTGRWLRLGFKFLAGLFVSVHVYALILFFAPVPGTANMAGRALQGTTLYHTWVPIEQISPHLIRAVIAAEDTKFCDHSGIDLEAIQDALDERERRGRLRGASTLTQQTAKNVFFSAMVSAITGIQFLFLWTNRTSSYSSMLSSAFISL